MKKIITILLLILVVLVSGCIIQKEDKIQCYGRFGIDKDVTITRYNEFLEMDVELWGENNDTYFDYDFWPVVNGEKLRNCNLIEDTTYDYYFRCKIDQAENLEDCFRIEREWDNEMACKLGRVWCS